MAASGFGGGEAFRLSAAPGAGLLKLHKGDITLWSVDCATDAIVRSSTPPIWFPALSFVFALTCFNMFLARGEFKVWVNCLFFFVGIAVNGRSS
jgi:hypothetical protein